MSELKLFHEASLTASLPKLRRMEKEGRENALVAIEMAKKINQIFRAYFTYFKSFDDDIEQIHAVKMDDKIKLFLIKRIIENEILRVSSREFLSEPLSQLIEFICPDKELDVGFSVHIKDIE